MKRDVDSVVGPLSVPYDDHMARTQTLVQLTDELVAALDEEAARLGTSRSALIRQAVEAHLAARLEERLTAAVIDGYTRIPQGAIDEWGDLSRQIESATRRTLQRLDEEEAAAGLSW